MKIYVTVVEVLREKERQKNETPKLMEKLIWVPVISFCKIFIPSYTHLMAYYAKTGCSHPLIT